MLTPLLAMIRKDLQLFFSDRRSVIVSFVVPIAIATFFGSIFSGAGSSNTQRARISVAVVDNDRSAVSAALVDGLAQDATLLVTPSQEPAAREAVRAGRTSVCLVIPERFGERATRSLLGQPDRPDIVVLYDPSRQLEATVVRGAMTQHVMRAIARSLAGGAGAGSAAAGSLVFSAPYDVHEEAMAGPNSAYNGYAHSFGGMGVQFLLFAMANLGVEMLLERQRGLWRRLRSAPISRLTLLGGKAASGAIISFLILAVCFAFAIVAFHVRVRGSVIGFIGVIVACSLMASTFGLLVAALGNSPATARGVTTLAVLMLVMLGGAWVPTFVFPAWVQRMTVAVPVRWAIDGLDATTWRGTSLQGVLAPIAVLLAFAAAFSVIAAARFRWEET